MGRKSLILLLAHIRFRPLSVWRSAILVTVIASMAASPAWAAGDRSSGKTGQDVAVSADNEQSNVGENSEQTKGQTRTQKDAPEESDRVTQEDVIRRNDPRANIKIFSSMNEEAGAGSRGAWEEETRIANETPDYIEPLGDYPNTVYPVYPEAATKPWIYNPPEDRIPEQLKKAIRGEEIEPTPAQKRQQEFNKGTYREPTNHPFKKRESGESMNSQQTDEAGQNEGEPDNNGANGADQDGPGDQDERKPNGQEPGDERLPEEKLPVPPDGRDQGS